MIKKLKINYTFYYLYNYKFENEIILIPQFYLFDIFISFLIRKWTNSIRKMTIS